MMNPKDKNGDRIFEPGHPLFYEPSGHKVDGLPSFDEIAAGGTPSLYTGGVPSQEYLTVRAEQTKQARSFNEAQKSDPNYEPEAVGDPSREWIRRLAKADPARSRAILEGISALPPAEQRPALQAAYTKFYYYEREGAAS